MGGIVIGQVCEIRVFSKAFPALFKILRIVKIPGSFSERERLSPDYDVRLAIPICDERG